MGNQATNIATAMVTQFGMSDKVGKVYYERQDLEKLSPELQNLINSEIKILLDESYDRAMNTLKTHRDKLELLAQELLKSETLNVDEIKNLVSYQDSLKESPFKFQSYQEPGLRPRGRKTTEPSESSPTKRQEKPTPSSQDSTPKRKSDSRPGPPKPLFS